MSHKLPLTEKEFEDIVEHASSKFGLPYDDDTRIATINYLHSLDRFVYEFDINILGAFLHKAFSSKITFAISHQIDLKRRKEDEERKAALMPVVPDPVIPTSAVGLSIVSPQPIA